MLWLLCNLFIPNDFVIWQECLVNVTSLFYLVPGVTAAMDWAFLGNPMSALMMGGLALVIVGLLIVFRYRAG